LAITFTKAEDTDEAYEVLDMFEYVFYVNVGSSLEDCTGAFAGQEGPLRPFTLQ
jgi:hypothetical protein